MSHVQAANKLLTAGFSAQNLVRRSKRPMHTGIRVDRRMPPVRKGLKKLAETGAREGENRGIAALARPPPRPSVSATWLPLPPRRPQRDTDEHGHGPAPTARPHHCVAFFSLRTREPCVRGRRCAHRQIPPAPPASLCPRAAPPTTPRPSARLALALLPPPLSLSLSLSLFTYKQALSHTPHPAFSLDIQSREKQHTQKKGSHHPLTPPSSRCLPQPTNRPSCEQERGLERRGGGQRNTHHRAPSSGGGRCRRPWTRAQACLDRRNSPGRRSQCHRSMRRQWHHCRSAGLPRLPLSLALACFAGHSG